MTSQMREDSRQENEIIVSKQESVSVSPGKWEKHQAVPRSLVVIQSLRSLKVPCCQCQNSVLMVSGSERKKVMGLELLV